MRTEDGTGEGVFGRELVICPREVGEAGKVPRAAFGPLRGIRMSAPACNGQNLRAGVCLPEWLRGWT